MHGGSPLSFAMLLNLASVVNAETPEILWGSTVDVFTSTFLAQGVLAALLHRERTGAGQHVEVSLLRSALACQVTRFTWAESEPWLPRMSP